MNLTTEINWRADIWSLAMVITEILTGEVPFDSPACRAMVMDNFVDALLSGMRPAIPQKIETAHPWLLKMVIFSVFYTDIVKMISILTQLEKAWSFDPMNRPPASELASIMLENGSEIIKAAARINDISGLENI